MPSKIDRAEQKATPKTYPALPPIDPAQRYAVAETTAYLRCSRARLYKRIARGDIKTIEDGRRTYVHGRELIRVSALDRVST
jgi:hypothetical protein